MSLLPVVWLFVRGPRWEWHCNHVTRVDIGPGVIACCDQNEQLYEVGFICRTCGPATALLCPDHAADAVQGLRAGEGLYCTVWEPRHAIVMVTSFRVAQGKPGINQEEDSGWS